MVTIARKGLGKAYEAFKKAGVIGDKVKAKDLKEIISKGKDLSYDSKRTGKMLDEVSGKLKQKPKKEPSEIDKAFKGMRDHFKKVEKSPEMKAYRKQENWPKTKYNKEEWSIKKYREDLKNKKNEKLKDIKDEE
jgi:hypothetical protein